MAKFYGEIGYATLVEEPADSGVWVEQITEVSYFGDVVRNIRKLDTVEQLNNDISVNNSISIMADAYANEHFFAMRYVRWQGARWIVTTVDVEPPRLTLRLGGIYNGPAPTVTPDP